MKIRDQPIQGKKLDIPPSPLSSSHISDRFDTSRAQIGPHSPPKSPPKTLSIQATIHDFKTTISLLKKKSIDLTKTEHEVTYNALYDLHLEDSNTFDEITEFIKKPTQEALTGLQSKLISKSNQNNEQGIKVIRDLLTDVYNPKRADAQTVQEHISNVLFQELNDDQETALKTLAQNNPDKLLKLSRFLENPRGNQDEILEEFPKSFFQSNNNIIRSLIKKYSDKIDQIFKRIKERIEDRLGHPLDRETQEQILSVLAQDFEAFEIFNQALLYLDRKGFKSDEEALNSDIEGFHQNGFGNFIVELSNLKNKANPDYIKGMVRLLFELVFTRSTSEKSSTFNAQFNSDGYHAKSRQLIEKEDYQRLLRNPETKSEVYTNDPIVLKAQQANIRSGQEWCKENGFPDTFWWPNGYSGRGPLFHAQWDKSSDPNSLTVSRSIGIMLGGRIRITRITKTLKSLKEKEGFLNMPPKDFQDECENRIHAMHRELVNAKKDSKKVFN